MDDKDKSQSPKSQNTKLDNLLHSIKSNEADSINLSNPSTQASSSIGVRFPLSDRARLSQWKKILHYYSDKIITDKEAKTRSRIWLSYFTSAFLYVFGISYMYHYTDKLDFFSDLILKKSNLRLMVFTFPIVTTGLFWYVERSYDKKLFDKY